jgi:hypothetical protein
MTACLDDSTSDTFTMFIRHDLFHFFFLSDWLDLWFSYRGYSDWVQDALPWLEIHLLHAGEACIQGISPYQSFRSSAPGSPVGSWFR